MAPSLRLDRVLGVGAGGRVWHAVLEEPWGELARGSAVAVKYPHLELEHDAAAQGRFELELAAGRALRGAEGIVCVLGEGRDERGRYLVMPYVPGRTLRDVLLEDGPLPEPLLRTTGRQLAAGLAALHAAGYAHGDVKPENVRLDAEGRAVLLDLGFARPLERGRGSRAPAPRPGSLAYLAPEQARGEAGGPAADVFALGVVLFELATGVHPFLARASTPPTRAQEASRAALLPSASSGEVARSALLAPDADRLLAAIATPRAPAPSRLVPQLSPFLDALLEELLVRAPSRRPSAAELERRLREGESGAWWRTRIDFTAGARRSSVGEPSARHLTPLVGRERELAELERAFARVREQGRGLFVWIAGPAGSGKSRLVHELAGRARQAQEPPLYLYGRCHRLEEERPGAPILRMLERWLRLPPGEAPGERERAALQELVRPRAASALLAVLGAGDEERTAPMRAPLALAAWLAELGRRTPTIVFLDDLTWAGEETLEVLASLAEELAQTRLLVVLGLRPDVDPRHPARLEQLRARLAGASAALALELAPLSEEQVLALVHELFAADAPALRLAEVLWRRSRGNPGFVAEILRGLVARGDAQADPESGRLRLRIAPDELPLPGSLPAAIADSYRGLAREQRAWLRRLAVVGGRLEAGFLVRAFPPATPAEVERVLAGLARRGWLVSAGSRYRFARPALREAVYTSLRPEQRRTLHRAAARALEAESGERSSIEQAFQLAFHLRAADEHEAVLERVEPLIERLIRVGQPQRVHSLSRWGLEALEALPPTAAREGVRVRLLQSALDAADRIGDRPGQRELLDRLADVRLDPDLDPLSAGRVYLLHGRYAVSTGQYGLARGMLRNAVLLFERAEAELELSESLRRLAAVQAHVGELGEARELALRAIQTSVLGPQRAIAWLALGVVDVLEDRFEDALTTTVEAVRLLRTSADWHLPGAVATALVLRSRILRPLGRLEQAARALERAVRLARAAGERRLEAEATARLGGVLTDLDRPQEGETRLREALLLADEIEDRRGRALASLFLGLLLASRGEARAAGELESCAGLAESLGLNRIQALSLAVSARLALARGDEQAARAASQRAIALLEQVGAELFDRILIEATAVRVGRRSNEKRAATRRLARLRERLERESERVQSAHLRAAHRRAAERLLAAALEEDGPAYPRLGSGA